MGKAIVLYTPDEHDAVFEEADSSRPLSGAPLPSIVAAENKLFLAYYTKLWLPEGRPNSPVLVSGSSLGTISLTEFECPIAFFSVPVSNETFDAHPLAFRGLSGYGVFRVENSSWIRRLTAVQYYHSKPYPGAFSDKKHFIFVFHDSIVEVAADDLRERSFDGSMIDAQGEMLQLMRDPSS
jgi:hypothetical protein